MRNTPDKKLIEIVASKNQKEFIQDLKPVYKAINKETAELELLKLEEKWGKKYPVVIKSWKDKWDNLSAYFKYPQEIRRIIYTTNIIESVHRQFKKLTKTKGAFPNENSLLKLLYLGIQNAKKEMDYADSELGSYAFPTVDIFSGQNRKISVKRQC